MSGNLEYTKDVTADVKVFAVISINRHIVSWNYSGKLYLTYIEKSRKSVS